MSRGEGVVQQHSALGGSWVGSASQGSAFWRGLWLPVALLGIWELSTRLGWVNTRVLVRPSLVFDAALDQARGGELSRQVFASIGRAVGGALLGSLVGVLVGVLLGVSRRWERLIGPTLHAAKQVAIFAWIPLMSVWLGTGEPAKVIFIGLGAFYPVALSTFEGIRSVSRQHVEVARVLCFTKPQIFRRVVLPGAAPSILSGVQLGLLYAWLATLGAEYLLAPAAGVGNLMIDGREQFRMDKVLVGVILVGALGLALSSSVRGISARILRGRSPST